MTTRGSVAKTAHASRTSKTERSCSCGRVFLAKFGRKCPTCKGQALKVKTNKRCEFQGCGALMAPTAKGIYCRPHSSKEARGERRYQDGYVVVRREGKDVFEHRVVYSEFIGRALFEHENVHHKNGVRDDNRLSNLELWITTQPSGQRVEDVLAWALYIVETYGDLQ